MRIVTRGDLDGLAASVLISEMEEVDGIVLVHPQDITDRKFVITAEDILANLPYHPACGMWFDHHEHTVLPETGKYRGAYALSPSVARVVYDYYDSGELRKYRHLVDETDRFDSARLNREDIMDPQGVILLGFLIDPRTGMGGDYRGFFTSLVQRLREKGVEALLADPDLLESISLYRESSMKFHDFLLANSEVEGNVVMTDFRKLDRTPIGNRFLVYTTFPHCNVSIRIQWGPGKEFVAVNIGHSILNRSCRADVGRLCREYGGGGHRGAGACVLSPSTADLEIYDILDRLVEHD
jgi:hypothetical protein